MCHVTDSLYLVGFDIRKLILWNEQTMQQLLQISDDSIVSIKRVLTSNKFIVKAYKKGVKVLTLDDLKSN